MRFWESSGKGGWVYMISFLWLSVGSTFGNPELPQERNKSGDGRGEITDGLFGERNSEAPLPRFNAGAVVIGDGANTPPRLIKRTPLRVTDLPVGYVQDRKIELSFLLDETGKIVDLKISPFRGELPASMVESIMAWELTPFVQQGSAVACIYEHQERILPFSVILQGGELANVPPRVKNPRAQCVFVLGQEEIQGSILPKMGGHTVRSKNLIYPTYARGYSRFGTLLLSGIVDKKGSLKKVKVEEAEYPEFRKAAKKIVKKWEFFPGRKSGKFVSSKVWIDLVIYPPRLELIEEEDGLVPPLVLKACALGGEFGFSDRLGVVSLILTIDEHGKMEDVEVEYSRIPELAERARKSFSKWEFRPGSRDGKAVKTQARYSMYFRRN